MRKPFKNSSHHSYISGFCKKKDICEIKTSSVNLFIFFSGAWAKLFQKARASDFPRDTQHALFLFSTFPTSCQIMFIHILICWKMLLINAGGIFYNHLGYWLHSLKAKELLTSKYLLLCYNRHELFWFFEKDWLWEGVTEDGMVGWHRWLNGHEFEQTPGDSGGKGSLAYFSPWGSQRIRHNLATEQQFWFFLRFFLCVPYFKVFIEFVTILLLFYVLVFWPRGMWDSWPGMEPMPPALEGEVLTTGLPEKSLNPSDFWCFFPLAY